MKNIINIISKIIFVLIAIIFFIIFILNVIKEYKIKNQMEQEEIKWKTELEENKKHLEDIIEKAKNIDKSAIYAYNKPYILEDFKYITGDYNSGYTIQDDLGNEFVWVPCTLEENEHTTIFNRYNFNNETTNFLDTKVYQCMEKDESIEELIQSIQKYGGFYIARYEAGKENEALVSKPNVQAWNNVSKKEALELATNMYDIDEFKSTLVNSFAWDTTLKWIEQTNNIKCIEEKINNQTNNLYITGQKSINNIYDMDSNVSEWTTEMLEEYAIFRAGEFYNEDLNKTSSYVGSRNVISENAKYDMIGFRVILFKTN